MKIIHITASYKPAYIYGGPIQSVGKLCEVIKGIAEQKSLDYAQDDKRLELEVITTTANGMSELDIKTGSPVSIEGVPITYFKRWTKDHTHFSPGLLWGLTQVLRQAQHNNTKIIIHIHAWWNLVSVLSCVIAKWYYIPVVLSPRGMLTSYTLGNRNSFYKNLIHKIMGKNLLKYCHIHATSEQERNDILKIVLPKSIKVIPNLVSLPLEMASDKYQEKSIKNRADDFFKLIFLSRIEEKKGLELLFKALACVDIPWKLTIAGSGEKIYLQSLKLMAKELKLNDNIYWIGQLSNQDKYMMMAAHDLLLLTSYNENFANVVIESLSTGTPVLISRHVGLADYVKDNELGWVTGLEIDEIKNNIVSAYLNTEKRQHIRNTASLSISRDFSDDVLVKQYLEFYKTI